LKGLGAKPGLYREFGNEDGLLKAVLVVYPQQVLATVYQRIATDAPFRATLDGLVSIVTRSGDTPFFGDAQAVPSGCLFAKMRESYRHLGEETRAEVDRAKAKILTLYSANIYFYKPLPAVSLGAPACRGDPCGRPCDRPCFYKPLPTVSLGAPARGAPTGSPVRSVMVSSWAPARGAPTGSPVRSAITSSLSNSPEGCKQELSENLT
jgi:hypothetical protein